MKPVGRHPGIRTVPFGIFLGLLAGSSSIGADDVRLAASEAGSAGILRGADIRMDVTVSAPGVVATNGTLRFDPGFVGGLPNRPPQATEVQVARAAGIPTSFPASWIHRSASDPDGDRLRVLSVSPVSGNGGRAEFYSGWVLFTPSAGDATTDLLRGLVVDSYGDTVETTIRVLPDGGPEPDWAGRGIPPKWDPEGGLLLRFAGRPGRIHRLQAATDPDGGAEGWRDVAELTADSHGLATYVANGQADGPMRFFRLVEP